MGSRPCVAALVEDVDYGTFGNAKKPAMLKSGAEMLLLAAGLGFANDRLDDQAARDHIGITYRCTVYRPDGSIVATCDGYSVAATKPAASRSTGTRLSKWPRNGRSSAPPSTPPPAPGSSPPTSTTNPPRPPRRGRPTLTTR